jgi:hypothetical protein
MQKPSRQTIQYWICQKTHILISPKRNYRQTLFKIEFVPKHCPGFPGIKLDISAADRFGNQFDKISPSVQKLSDNVAPPNASFYLKVHFKFG